MSTNSIIRERHPLDIFDVPLAGLTLIEASAGTGKTWTITGLYLRLVLEAGLSVDQILVVTYTKAATGELRDRVRRRLTEALAALNSGETSDALLQTLIARLPGRAVALQRINRALTGFDEAAIFTIHGFCQRVLGDSAFESGQPFALELVADETELLQSIADDFWRREVSHCSELFAEFLLAAQLTPEALLAPIRKHIGKPFLELRGVGTPPNSQPLEAEYSTAYVQVRQIWQQDCERIVDLLAQASGLNRNKYRPASLPAWVSWMTDYLAPERPMLAQLHADIITGTSSKGVLERFTTSALEDACNKGAQPLAHPFFAACDRLLEAYHALSTAYALHVSNWEYRLLDYANAALPARKRRQRQLSYNDLLLNLRQALAEDRHEVLASTLRQRYRAALIDEFQDTDPVQYEIFQRIYQGHELPVFLVGDPKQAIYSFRGADVFAYLAAHRQAQREFTLDRNWRSTPALIEAVNALYSGVPQPFLLADIGFTPVQPAPQELPPFVDPDGESAALHLWLLERAEDGAPINKSAAAERATQATVSEIVRLLSLGAQNKVCIGERGLHGGDIAVLVRGHRHGRMVHEALRQQGVASVQYGQDNVFQSFEALELERLLLAIVEPNRSALVKAALATDLLGVSGEALAQLDSNEAAWEARIESFQQDHRRWRDHGFMQMFSAWLAREEVAARLLSFVDGERRLTNLLHLAELIHGAAHQARLGMEALVKWLAGQRQAPASADEAVQLRLESDEQLVRILTIHAAKGLEYAVVFCPFLWDAKLWSERERPVLYHLSDAGAQPGSRAALDFDAAANSASRTAAVREEQAENLRLLYVALTRAKYRCYLAWGAVKEAGQAALAWLLHAPQDVAKDGAAGYAQVEQRFAGLSDAELRADLARLIERANGAIRIMLPPADSGLRYTAPAVDTSRLAARSLRRPVTPGWRVISFSALTATETAAQAIQKPELPDYDAVAQRIALVEADAGFLAFPRGPRAGRCLHAIFEHLDFTQRSRAALEALVERSLTEHGFDTRWIGAVSDMTQRVLATPLEPSGSIKLNRVSAAQRLNELEFYYPVASVSEAGLKRLLGERLAAGNGQIEELHFSPQGGYMKGYIDLVFELDGRYYLADYKSNWLGAQAADYQTERLAPAMAREWYTLQYLIYSVALHRYLRNRLPDYDYEVHFGGVYYLFLRGMDPALGPEYGVFRDRPVRALVEALDDYFATGTTL